MGYASTRRVVCVMVAALAMGSAAHGQSCPPQRIQQGDLMVALRQVADTRLGHAVDHPVGYIDAGDPQGRSFVLNRSGTVMIMQGGTMLTQPFLDVTNEILFPNNRGLLGLAFHPQFSTIGAPGFGRVYTWYTQEAGSGVPQYTAPNPTHQIVLCEWQVSQTNPNQIDPATRRELLRLDHRSVVHSGGAMEWGPDDGYLYISIGTPINHNPTGQDNSVPAGTVIRIDPLHPSLSDPSRGIISPNGQYRIPSDNPFVGMMNRAPEIWAFGLRHHWRMSFDRVTGLLFAGDVGASSYEEITLVGRARNLGWPYWEGFCPGPVGLPNPPPETDEPLAAYSHDDGVAVIGGYVYRGNRMPWLRGKYVFAEYSRFGPPTVGRLLYMNVYDNNGQVLPPSEIRIRDFVTSGGVPMMIHSLGEDRDGELYIVGRHQAGAQSFHGVFKFVPACPADCDQSTGAGVLDIFDFLCFGNLFSASDPYACDCDMSTGVGVCDIFDFLCFGNAFSAGCQ